MKLSRRAEKISSSATLAITAREKALKKEGKDVVGFGAGEPDFDTPFFIKNFAIKAIREGFTKYTPSTGIPELKEAICRKLKTDNNLEYAPSQITVSCGAKHALYNIFQVLLEEGDEVLIPFPFWVSYPEMVSLAGGIPVVVDSRVQNGFKATRGSIEAKLSPKTKALILNSPSNPAGVVYTREDLREIAALAKERSFYIISDEIYEKIIYENEHVSIASLDKDISRLAVVVNGVSKTYSMTGWRIGYSAAPENVAQAVGKLQDHSTSNPSSISQKAALAAIQDARSGIYIGKMVREFRKRRDFMVERLGEINGFSPFAPKGAFYVFCNIEKTGLAAADLAKTLLEEKLVAVVPGESFGSGGFIRLSFATSMKNIKKGLDRIEEWSKEAVRQ